MTHYTSKHSYAILTCTNTLRDFTSFQVMDTLLIFGDKMNNEIDIFSPTPKDQSPHHRVIIDSRSVHGITAGYQSDNYYGDSTNGLHLLSIAYGSGHSFTLFFKDGIEARKCEEAILWMWSGTR